MPCHDDREETDRQDTVRAACEMAKVIRAAGLYESLSKATQEWITDHEKWDAILNATHKENR